MLDKELRILLEDWYDVVGQLDGAESFDEPATASEAAMQAKFEAFPAVGDLLRLRHSRGGATGLVLGRREHHLIPNRHRHPGQLGGADAVGIVAAGDGPSVQKGSDSYRPAMVSLPEHARCHTVVYAYLTPMLTVTRHSEECGAGATFEVDSSRNSVRLDEDDLGKVMAQLADPPYGSAEYQAMEDAEEHAAFEAKYEAEHRDPDAEIESQIAEALNPPERRPTQDTGLA